MVSVLVTGAAGFIGSHIAEKLALMGYNVIGIDNLSRKKLLKKDLIVEDYNWNQLKKLKNVELRKIDVTDFEGLKELPKADAIIHTAAQVAVTTSIEDPRKDLEINMFGTFNVLELARKFDSKVIFTSTNKVYGENVNKIPIKETPKRYMIDSEDLENGIPENFPIDLTAHTPYGCSKLAADIYVQDYAHTYGLKTYVLRMSCIYGERQFGVEDQGWVAWFTIATLKNKEITIYGNGKQVRDVLYIDDLEDLVVLLIESNIASDVFNIGGGKDNTISLIELLEILEKITGKRAKIKFSKWRPHDQKVYVSDIRKIKEKTGWIPKIKVEEGIERLISWVNENIALFNGPDGI